MTSLNPNTVCVISKRIDKGYDFQGRPKISTSRTKTKCSVIWLKDSRGETSVRVDTSASRSHAEETLSDGKFLLKPKADIDLGDIVKINVGGNWTQLQVTSIFRRQCVNGNVHHIECEGMIWEG